MARKLRIAAIGLAVALGVIVIVLSSAYFAMKRVRPFYQQALNLEPQVLADGSRELETRATALYSDAQQPGEWRSVFTAEQINGWLAIQLADGGPHELPEEISSPRVAIANDTLTLGFRSRRGGLDTIVSADATVELTDAGSVAVRLLSVRAGALPLPAMHVAEEIARACQELSLPVRWTRYKGQPVALVDIQPDESKKGRRLYVDAIELRDGSLYVAGHTQTDSLRPNIALEEDQPAHDD